MHTAIEIVLRTVLAAGKNARFPQLLERAETASIINEDDRAALTQLHDHRRTVKHHACVIPIDQTDAVRADLWRAASSLDRLQDRLARVEAAE